MDIVDRDGNRKTLSFLGLTKKNAEEIVLGLSVTDYSAGPKPDQDKPGHIWEFGKDIDGYEVYIKLKLADAADTKLAKCISFHIAQRPISYPFKRNVT